MSFLAGRDKGIMGVMIMQIWRVLKAKRVAMNLQINCIIFLTTASSAVKQNKMFYATVALVGFFPHICEYLYSKMQFWFTLLTITVLLLRNLRVSAGL